MRRRLALLTIATLISAALVGCDRRAPTPSPTPTPSTSAAPRLVVLSPALGLILADLGLAPLIVGRHGFDAFLPSAIPVCGDQGGLDYERLLTLSPPPTHILLEWGERPLPPRLTELAREHHWIILNISMMTLDDIERVTLELRETFPPTLPTPALPGPSATDLRARFAKAWGPEARSDRPHSRRVLLLGNVDPPCAFGPRSWHYQLLERLGGTPAITQGTPWITLDVEDVLKLAPDVIILIDPRPPHSPAPAPPSIEALRARLGRVGTLDIPAIRDRRIHLLDDPRAHTPSTAMLDLAEELANILSPTPPPASTPRPSPEAPPPK